MIYHFRSHSWGAAPEYQIDPLFLRAILPTLATGFAVNQRADNAAGQDSVVRS
jgi:hypothetical protein